MITTLLSVILALLLTRVVIKSIKRGSLEWYYGENFNIHKNKSPFAFWIMICFYSMLCLLFAYGALRQLL